MKKLKCWRRLSTVLPGLEIDLERVQTNIIIFKPNKTTVETALQKCKEKGLLISMGNVGFLRAVTHLDVSFEEAEKAVNILEEIFG